ncbi:MAG: prepilin-type N-terminal cleavage/methylation domain-containing protein [Planctomycetota bacterium]
MQPKKALSRTGVAHAGFTLIELLVGITIIALLAALLISGLSRAVQRARSTGAQQSVDALVLAVTQFENEFGFYPPLVHDGAVISDGENARRPSVEIDGEVRDGPLVSIDTGDIRFERLVVWSEGEDLAFFRRRTGEPSGSDPVEITSGGEWDDDTAWSDLRYSKYALAFYLSGVGGKRLDGVTGPGFARPQSNGLFVGVGYPVGSTRDRYDPVIDADTGSLRQVTGYFERLEFLEHDSAEPGTPMPTDAEVAFVDPWGRAYRYYRWEPGRLEDGRLVVETTLDLNIPPVLVDAEIYAEIRNDPSNASDDRTDTDLTSDDAELRSARFAIVSAGADGFFGTEPIEEIARGFRERVPTTIEGKVSLRDRAMADNIVGLGK